MERSAHPSLPPAPQPPSPPPQMEVEAEGATVEAKVPSPSSPPSTFSVPSPALLAKESPENQRPRLCQILRNENTEDLYGSEASDDEELAAPFFPRAQRSALETPVDSDIDDSAPVPAATATPAEYATASTSSSIPDVSPRVTDQPWSLYDFDWQPFSDAPIPPESRREKFSDINVGPTAPCVDPYEIFTSIWDRQFMEYIALETNRYAEQVATQMFDSGDLIGSWHSTTADELYVFFALLLSMGVVINECIEEYWSATSGMFCTPGFSVHMSLRRFQILCRCLHFQNNEDMCRLELDASEAKLFKIQPVLSHLNNRFQSMYRPRQNIALDESLLQCRGFLDIRLIPNKVMGIKTYEICESQTGYLWRFEVHAHNQRSSSHQPEDPLNASTPAIVLRLIHGLEGQGYTLWMDNFYNSPILARHLKSIGFDCVGTLRTNRRFVPQALHSLDESSMRPGQISGLTSGDVDVMVWRDVNRVAMISTYHGNATAVIRGSTKPILILDYNNMMGGVDKKDYMLSMYPIERRQSKVWYKKLFWRLLNVSVLNSYIIYSSSFTTTTSSSSSYPLDHLSFRKSLINSILSKHSLSSRSQPATPTNDMRQRTSIDLTHRIAEYPYSVKKKQRLRRKCVICRKPGYRFCVGCNKTVCMDPCFVTLHSS